MLILILIAGIGSQAQEEMINPTGGSKIEIRTS